MWHVFRTLVLLPPPEHPHVRGCRVRSGYGGGLRARERESERVPVSRSLLRGLISRATNLPLQGAPRTLAWQLSTLSLDNSLSIVPICLFPSPATVFFVSREVEVRVKAIALVAVEGLMVAESDLEVMGLHAR